MWLKIKPKNGTTISLGGKAPAHRNTKDKVTFHHNNMNIAPNFIKNNKKPPIWAVFVII